MPSAKTSPSQALPPRQPNKMPEHHDFTPAIVGPDQPHAQFDRLHIQTDTLTATAQDRVLPILAEEQVFTCRQMAPTLRSLQTQLNRGLTVLDIGTGSGVLAIYAERVLNQAAPYSTVQGVDRSPRAIAQAQHNSQANHCHPDYTHFHLVPDGYNHDSVAPASQDIIITNPPFNPTYPGLQGNLAFFGDSDDSGLHLFKTWMPAIAHHLRPTGILLGCQLSPVVDGTVVALDVLRHTFGPTSHIEFCHILDGTCSMEAFLLGEYQDYLQTLPTAHAQPYRDWIAHVSTRYPAIAFVYYEAHKTGGHQAIVETLQPRWLDFDRTWASRIILHRDFVNSLAETAPLSPTPEA